MSNAKTIVINGKRYSCPYYEAVPRPTEEERAALESDIRANGVIVPVLVTGSDEVIDGHTRAEIAEQLGVGVEVVVKAYRDDAHKREEAVRLNVHRRQLSRDQRRQLIDRELQRDPSRSDRAIAEQVGTTDKTVGTRRVKTGAESPQVRRGRDGKRYKTAPKTTPPAPAVDATATTPPAVPAPDLPGEATGQHEQDHSAVCDEHNVQRMDPARENPGGEEPGAEYESTLIEKAPDPAPALPGDQTAALITADEFARRHWTRLDALQLELSLATEDAKRLRRTVVAKRDPKRARELIARLRTKLDQFERGFWGPQG